MGKKPKEFYFILLLHITKMSFYINIVTMHIPSSLWEAGNSKLACRIGFFIRNYSLHRIT